MSQLSLAEYRALPPDQRGIENWKRLTDADREAYRRKEPAGTEASSATSAGTVERTEPTEPANEPTVAEKIARIQENVKAATAGSVETRAKVRSILGNWSAAGGLHAPAVSKDAGPQPRSATEARILFNTGKLKQPFSDETKRLLAEAGCAFEKSSELKRVLANSNPSALTDAERAEAFPQSPELARILSNTGRRKD
jgi:hypothetical protein